MMFNISYMRNEIPQTILVEGNDEKVVLDYFQARKPDAHICGIKEATNDDMRPGKPVLRA